MQRLKRCLRQMEGQHRHLRPMYAELVDAVERWDVEETRQWLDRFRDALEAHFALEEDTLFPALHGCWPHCERSLKGLLEEHAELREEMGYIEGELAGALSGAIARRVLDLRISLAEHERREEKFMKALVDPEESGC